MDNVIMLLLVFVALVLVAYSFGSTDGGSPQIPTIPMAPQPPPMYQLGADFQYSEEHQDAHSMADPEESANLNSEE